jgi:hypothetical protein
MRQLSGLLQSGKAGAARHIVDSRRGEETKDNSPEKRLAAAGTPIHNGASQGTGLIESP